MKDVLTFKSIYCINYFQEGLSMSMLFLLLTIVFIFLNIAFSKKPRTAKNIIEIILVYMFAILIGIGGIIAWFMHTFNGATVAAGIGWPAGNPFQLEVAVANLGYGIAGIMAIWIRKEFWLATAVASSTFLIGAGAVHIYDIMTKGNFNPLNAGAVLYINDLFIPITLLILTVVYLRMEKK